MNRKVFVVGSVIILVAFFGIKLNNFLIGQKILGEYTSITSDFLKIKPIKKTIKHINVRSYLACSLAGITFNVPKTDTLKTFKLREVYKSLYFRDSSRVKVFNDTIELNLPKILRSVGDSNGNILKEFIRKNNINSNFDLLLFAYNKSPNDIGFFNLSKKNTIIQYTFLRLKDLCAVSGAEKGLYFFVLKNIKGFQYGDPKLSERTIISLYTKSGKEYTIVYSGFKQEQIDYMVASIDDSLK